MPDTFEYIQGFFEEIGKRLPEINIVAQLEEIGWAVEFADETIVQIEWLDRPSRLLLTASLGHIKAERQLEVCAMLLTFNFSVSDTHGAKVALTNPQEAEAMLIQDWYADTLSLETFLEGLSNFKNLVDGLSAYVTDESTTAEFPSALMHLRA